jgi:hypothetical protein
LYVTFPVKDSLFLSIFSFDKEIAEDFFNFGCCRHCKSKALSWSNYNRKPRGLPKELSQDTLDKYRYRFSFICRPCRLRTTPPSVRFMGRKVYTALSILWISLACEQGISPPLHDLRILMESCLSQQTIERWMRWWQHNVWNCSFWKTFRGQLLGEIKKNQIILGVWNHFKQQIMETASLVNAILKFFSPITRPEIYPF